MRTYCTAQNLFKSFYLFMAVLGLHCCVGLIQVQCLVASVAVAPGLQRTGSTAVPQAAACGILLDQGSNLRLLHWQVSCIGTIELPEMPRESF